MCIQYNYDFYVHTHTQHVCVEQVRICSVIALGGRLTYIHIYIHTYIQELVEQGQICSVMASEARTLKEEVLKFKVMASDPRVRYVCMYVQRDNLSVHACVYRLLACLCSSPTF
jgi:hypothetical protein